MRNNIPKSFYLLFLMLCLVVFTICKKLEKEMLVSTGEVTNILTNSAEASGSVIDPGDGATQYGHCYGKTPNVTVAGSKTELGKPLKTGDFTSRLTDLEAGTKYYIKAYMTDDVMPVYGKEISFTTASPSLPSLTTTAITSVTTSTATGGGDITGDGGAPVTSRGVCWKTSTGPTTADSKTSDGTGTGSFTSNITGLTPATTYYARAYATNSAGIAYGNELSFTTTNETTGTVTDADGNIYNKITLGTQTWIKENLKTTKYNDGTAIAIVTDNTTWGSLNTGACCWYNNNESLYRNTYGALYNWFAVHTEKLCPTGWHVPSDPEWTDLENYLIANGYNYDGTTTENKIAKAMVATTTWVLSDYAGSAGNTDYPAARNKSGFSGVAAGMRDGNGTFDFLNYDANWWSSTANIENAWNRTINTNYTFLERYNHNKIHGLSVRCVKD